MNRNIFESVPIHKKVYEMQFKKNTRLTWMTI